uniref:ParB-like N-terminal domain-containing protein n=1 Tax=Biomphalaria glabrata TaxID=6526 RepID=A0A2C9LK28_BIOGL
MSKALGRGLSALIGDSTDTINKGYHAEKNNHAIYALPIHILHAGSLQPRKHFDQEDIKNLAESIKANGIIQPLIVRKSNDNSFEIIAGERRWRAAMLAELDHVP